MIFRRKQTHDTAELYRDVLKEVNRVYFNIEPLGKLSEAIHRDLSLDSTHILTLLVAARIDLLSMNPVENDMQDVLCALSHIERVIRVMK